jgi:hypothetical protein
VLGAAGNGTGPSTARGAVSRGCVLALLPEEPAGRISTRNAGAISFRVTLKTRPGEGMPFGPILGDPSPGARFYSLILADDPASATRRISCEIRALHDEQLTAALDSALRAVTAHAALTEAVLETRAVRLAGPSETPASLLKELAQHMSGAGLRATLGPCWTPAPGADVSVGTRGLEETFEAFLQAHPKWRPPHPR